MGFLTGKTAIITGGGYSVLSDGRCGSIGYGIANVKDGVLYLFYAAIKRGEPETAL